MIKTTCPKYCIKLYLKRYTSDKVILSIFHDTTIQR